MIATDPFWLYPVPLLPWNSYICLSVELFTSVSVSVLKMLCMRLNANADQCWYGHKVCLCVLMFEISSSIIPPSACLVSMMHQQSATPHYSSAQAGGQHYQGQQSMSMMGQGSQGNSMMSQRPMGSYRSSQQGRWSTSSSFVWRWVSDDVFAVFECLST